LTKSFDRRTIRSMDEDGLDPREAERVRRRDREARAAQRELMRAGMGKVFKQIRDAQKQAADELPDERPRRPKRVRA
jgi:hypothetical protein